MASKETNNNSTLSFKSFVHYRRLKEIIKKLCIREEIDYNVYNLNNIRCYTCIGNNLKAPTVSYQTKNNYSIFVSDNRYFVAEVPHKNNRENSTNGVFLFLAFNKSFDYTLFGVMKVRKGKDSKIYTESVRYIPKGCYKISYLSRENLITKTQNGYDISFGGSVWEHNIYDFYESRKNAYDKTLADLTAKKNRTTNNSEKIFSKNKVKIYKKKFKK